MPGSLIDVTALRAQRLRTAVAAIPPYASASDREKGSLLCIAIGRHGEATLAYDMLLADDPVLQVIL